MNSGFSAARLARVRAVIAGYVERGAAPGVVTLLSRHGEVRVDAVGAMTVGGAPVARDTIFRVASMSKPVTAVAALMLVEECVLRLDDPVDGLLPELADRRVLARIGGPLDDTVPAHRPITLRDLLTFRLGIGFPLVEPGTEAIVEAAGRLGLGPGLPDPGAAPGPDEWLRRFATLPLVCQPGERWFYNTGYDVLSVLIARAAGQSLPDFLRERIFDPLGMVDTGFHVPADRLDRLATAYAPDPESGGLRVVDEPAGTWSRPPLFPSGAGGLVSTVDDFLAFGRMLLDGGRYGGGRLLARPTVEAMTTNQLTAAQRAASGLYPGYFDHRGWGFGGAVVIDRDSTDGSPGRFGWDGGLGTSWHIDPREDLVGILMTQRAWTSPRPPDICSDFWTSAYQALGD